MQHNNDVVSVVNETKTEKCHLLVLPYAVIKAEKVVKSMNKSSSIILPTNVKLCIDYSGRLQSVPNKISDQNRLSA